MFQTQTFLASHTNTKSPTTTKTAGRMQAEKHRSALPTGPIQASGALPGHGIVSGAADSKGSVVWRLRVCRPAGMPLLENEVSPREEWASVEVSRALALEVPYDRQQSCPRLHVRVLFLPDG